MTLDQTSLRLFIAVVDEGTIAAAAEREHIAAPAISKRIKELESALNVQLLERHFNGVTPTAAGRELLILARRAIFCLEDLQVQMADYATGIRGQIRVFANISAITQFLPNDLASFLEKYPKIKINLEETNSTTTVKAVVNNEADIGIFTHYSHGSPIETLPYQTDRLGLIVRHDHPFAKYKKINFVDTLDNDFVGLRTGSAINMQLTKAASDLSKTIRLRVQVTGYDALCLMVSAGLGIAIAPKGLIRHYVNRLGLKEISLLDQWANRQLCIGVTSMNNLPTAAHLLVTHLRESTINR